MASSIAITEFKPPSSATSREEPTWTSFILWDINHEFQNAIETYERWLTKNQRRRTFWQCISGSSKEDALAKSLRFGTRVLRLIQDGREKFGQRFDKGDVKCQTILSAQLLRLQQEVCIPLLDSLHSRLDIPIIVNEEVLRAARGIRRSCLHALEDLTTRLSTKISTRRSAFFLAPPRFSVKYCPLALELQQDHRAGRTSKIQSRKLHSHDRYEDREICTYCKAHVSVAAHSGLPQYRRILFMSHTAGQRPYRRATLACTSCYKTFDDSYAFLEHVFQREIGSEKGCLHRYSIRYWTFIKEE